MIEQTINTLGTGLFALVVGLSLLALSAAVAWFIFGCIVYISERTGIEVARFIIAGSVLVVGYVLGIVALEIR